MILEKIGTLIERLRESMWLVPASMTAVAILLVTVTLAIDRNFGADPFSGRFFFNAGADGAREVLSTVAGSIITVTGVVFSITIVALQLASTQFTPRVLRSFMEDRADQIVLGIFISTFTFSLLVLRAVRPETDGADGLVPVLSVTTAVVLALVSIGALIYFVNHVAHSMQAETIVDRVTRDVLARIDVLFPRRLGEPAGDDGGQPTAAWTRPDAEPFELRASRGGYLQQIEEETILQVSEENDLKLEMAEAIGSFVLEGDCLALIWPAERAGEIEEQLESAFHLGSERTLYQDVKRGLIELTDIAVRALSPSTNDPTTAMICIERITQILKPLGGRDFPAPVRAGRDHQPRILAVRPTFEEIVRIPYGQLRHYGAMQPAIASALVESLGRVADGLSAERVRPLLSELLELLQAARREIQSASDLERVEYAGRQTLKKMQPG